jgi:hypothetical protein
MTQQPGPDPQIIRELSNYLKDDLNRFIFELHFRSLMLLENDKLPKSLVSLEMLQSVLSSREAGRQHSEISEAYPIKSWRDDTVEVPRAWIRELVASWEKYKKSEAQTTLGEAFGLEGGGQGVLPAKHRLDAMNRDTRIANAVVLEYLSERASGETGSWERAYGNVADQERVSLDTVKRATKPIRDLILNKLAELHVLKGGKSS